MTKALEFYVKNSVYSRTIFLDSFFLSFNVYSITLFLGCVWLYWW